MHFLLNKYKMKEPVLKAEMMNLINKKYIEQFSKILRLASERLELIFGLELKEVDPSQQSYKVVSKFSISNEERLNDGADFPRNGLLINLLSIIFLKGNRATEEEIWKFMNALGAHDGRKHPIYGEPRKLITKDLVQEGYLEYKQVPNSDPPCYEFLWGPRAHTDISNMQVLEFFAKINNTTPRAFPRLYKEALEDEERRAAARSAARPGPRGRASAGEGSRAAQGGPPTPGGV
ncbi:melanoma-associated antigen B1-like [Rhynchocyon petersi]